MSLYLFGLLVQQLEIQPVFSQDLNKNESLIPVKQQVFITLICIGTYKNGASLAKIGDLYRMRKGTVDKVCQRVFNSYTKYSFKIYSY